MNGKKNKQNSDLVLSNNLTRTFGWTKRISRFFAKKFFHRAKKFCLWDVLVINFIFLVTRIIGVSYLSCTIFWYIKEGMKTILGIVFKLTRPRSNFFCKAPLFFEDRPYFSSYRSSYSRFADASLSWHIFGENGWSAGFNQEAPVMSRISQKSNAAKLW